MFLWFTTALGADIDWRVSYATDLGALHQEAPICSAAPPEPADSDALMSELASSLFVRDVMVRDSRAALQKAGVADQVDGWITDSQNGFVTIHWVKERKGKPQTLFEASMEDGFHWLDDRGPANSKPRALPRSLRKGWACRTAVLAKGSEGPTSLPVEPIVVSVVAGEPWVFMIPRGSPSQKFIGGARVEKCEGEGPVDVGFGDRAYTEVPKDGFGFSIQRLASSGVNPTLMVQAAWNGQDMVALTQGHLWMVMAEEHNHYLGPVPDSEVEANARLKTLRAALPKGPHADAP